MSEHHHHWYRSAFRGDYLALYKHRSLDEARQHIAWIEDELALTRSDRILDFCCGGGRHLQVLLERGYDAVGFDLSDDLLHHGRERMLAADLRPVLARADMRDPPYAGPFDVLLNMFTSFGYFRGDGENLSVLAEMAKLLKPGGRFLLDLPNRDYVVRHLEPETTMVAGDAEVEIVRWLTPDGKRVEKRTVMRWTGDDRVDEQEYVESVRLFTMDELEEALQHVGMHVRTVFGGLNGEPVAEGLALRDNDAPNRWVLKGVQDG